VTTAVNLRVPLGGGFLTSLSILHEPSDHQLLMAPATSSYPRVVTGEKNSPTVAHACRKRRLKWVLPQVGGWTTGLENLLCKKFNRYRNLNNCIIVEALCSSGNEED
jgi:hypothetical protein